MNKKIDRDKKQMMIVKVFHLTTNTSSSSFFFTYQGFFLPYECIAIMRACYDGIGFAIPIYTTDQHIMLEQEYGQIKKKKK
jgi:hypothetical protein